MIDTLANDTLKKILIDGILTEEEIATVLNTQRKDRAHPMKTLFQTDDQLCTNFSEEFSKIEKILSNCNSELWQTINRIIGLYSNFSDSGDKKNNYTLANTKRAFNLIKSKDIKWLKKKASCLTEIDEYSTVSSVLGEIRAYGYLLDAGFQVNPINESDIKTPDFSIVNGKGEEIEIEVHSKQYAEIESSSLEVFLNTKICPNSNISKDSDSDSIKKNRIICREHSVTPFGKPQKKKIKEGIRNGEKEYEFIVENVISKLAAIKAKEDQLSSHKPSILWLDFQDELWNLPIDISHTFPIISGSKEFFSGGIWYAFFGKKNLPIFENHRFFLDNNPKRYMSHDGRFRMNDNKVNACVLSFPQDTIILENPWAKNPLPHWFFSRFTRIHFFNFSNSWMNWPDNKIKERIDIEICRIEELGKKLSEEDMY